jgi:hypothetical protein
MPPWEEVDETQGATEAFFITAQGDGTVVIWRIGISTDLKYEAEPVFSQYAFEKEIISTMKFHQISSSAGKGRTWEWEVPAFIFVCWACINAHRHVSIPMLFKSRQK